MALCVREQYEQREALVLSEYATLSARSRGRAAPEESDRTRTCFQRDVDRVVYSNAFRRLKHKTQVFLRPEGDHYRTRITHTLEVARIARTIARALSLNEDLCEAAALAHDLGHTPFGHAGERALNTLMPGGFKHHEHSLRVVDRLEKDGLGLNLTHEVRNSILCHDSEAPEPETPEGMIVRLSDKIAYINHDIDDAIRAGILTHEDIPREFRDALGSSHSARVSSMVENAIDSSAGAPRVWVDGRMHGLMMGLREFLTISVYENEFAKGEEAKVPFMLESLWNFYLRDLSRLPGEYMRTVEGEGPERAVCDFIAGMTDQYAVSQFGENFIPYAWSQV